jgi:hypothetical protein
MLDDGRPSYGLGSLALHGRGLIACSGYRLEVGVPSLGF